MQRRTAAVVLAGVVLASVALGYTDVQVKFVRPRTSEEPGPIPIQLMLTNLGDGPAMPQRLDMLIRPFNYTDYLENIPIGVGESRMVTLNPWVYGGGIETCMAWITYPQDENHHNDTDIVIVKRLSGLTEGGRTDLNGSPGGLGASIAHATCVVSHTEPLDVTLFDIRGRAVMTSRLDAAQAGRSLLDLSGLRSGVYLVRLDDGRRTVVRKLVVQR